MPAVSRICSVTVAYNPNVTRLAEQVAALRGQVDAVFIVDNGSVPDAHHAISALRQEGVSILPVDRNEGVGAGLNRGIVEAQRRGFTHVLLLDHDSVPAPDMVMVLRDSLMTAQTSGRVAAVGPRVRDSRDGHKFPFIRFGWLHNRRLTCGTSTALVDCDFLITSGSFIPISVFEDVGTFDASLFVEYVDLDWCCRARAKGYSLHGVCATTLDHELGEQPRKVAGALRILVHPPERMYYALRNRLLLYGRPYVPLKWKLKDIPRAALKLATALLFVAPRWHYARMALLALRDGAGGRGGPRDRLARDRG